MSHFRLYRGDCLKILPQLESNSVDLILCDLPYHMTACRWDSLIPFEPLWNEWHRVLRTGGSVLLFGSEPFSTVQRMSNFSEFKYDWIWKKNRPTGFQHAKNMPMKDFEIISVFSPYSMGHANLLGSKRMTYNPQGIQKCDRKWKATSNKFGSIVGKRPSHRKTGIAEFTHYPSMTLHYGKDKENFHPTQKPVALLSYLIKTYTNEGGTVLDNCMGAGSTGVAAMQANRKFIGIELDQKFFEISKDRIENAARIADLEFL